MGCRANEMPRNWDIAQLKCRAIEMSRRWDVALEKSRANGISPSARCLVVSSVFRRRLRLVCSPHLNPSPTPPFPLPLDLEGSRRRLLAFQPSRLKRRPCRAEPPTTLSCAALCPQAKAFSAAGLNLLHVVESKLIAAKEMS